MPEVPLPGFESSQFLQYESVGRLVIDFQMDEFDGYPISASGSAWQTIELLVFGKEIGKEWFTAGLPHWKIDVSKNVDSG